jgi:endonuclease-3
MDELTARAQTIYHRLLQTFGFPEWRKALSPVDELVSTILSQNTNDRNRDVAFDRLKAAFPTWEDVRDADPDDVIECIRPAGLANQKGPRIQTVLKEISAERGNHDLSFSYWIIDGKMKRDPGCCIAFKYNGVGPQNCCHCASVFIRQAGFSG